MSDKPETEDPLATGVRLSDCEEDRKKLVGYLRNQVKNVYREALECLEQALPFNKGEGSANETLFKILRRRILGQGNDVSRDIEDTLAGWITQEVLIREVVEKRVFRNPDDPNGLPHGVKLREQSQEPQGDS